MRIFLIIIATIAIISALIIGYAYNQFTYKPDYFEKVEPFDIQQISRQADETKERIARDLEKQGSARLDGQDIMQLGLNQLEQKTHLDLNRIIKKSKSEISGGRFKGEAVINVKALSSQKLAAHTQKYVDSFLNYLPDTMMEDVYIAIDGTPVNRNGVLYFNDDVTISVGDFTRDLSEITNNHDMKLDMQMLYQLGASEIIIKDNYLEIKK